MKIVDIDVSLKEFSLIKPYRIANKTVDKVSNCIVKLKLENGVTGIGAGAPFDFVTGETIEQCLQALNPTNLSWLLNQSIYCLPAQTRYVQSRFKHSPAAAAALDIALYDAYAKLVQLPLVDILGRVHTALPTSITIGIKEIDAAITEAEEYIARGFKILKIKLGEELEKDIEMIHGLRRNFANTIKIRVDMNQGYTPEELVLFAKKTQQFDIELIEQPFSRTNFKCLNQFPNSLKEKIAADESIISLDDAFNLVRQENLCGIFNIKLMKCGGISPALDIAKMADLAEIDLMWGCMDESIISIAAALHVALASTKTKYLDLDGSFDLADDLVHGGFILENGYLRTTDKPGLGVEACA